MPAIKSPRISRKRAAAIQAAAFRALHDRGHFTATERARMEADHCLCGNTTIKGNLLCWECVKAIASEEDRAKAESK